jgi:hypothetical protein
VLFQTGRLSRYTTESPAAAWYFLYSFFKKIHNVNFFEKRSGFFRPVGGETQPLEGRPRKSCKLQDLRGALSNRAFEPMKTRFACGSMVLVLSCSQKFGSQSQIFVNKDVQFRPAGGEMSFRVRDRVSPVTLHELRGVDYSGLVPAPKARFACGSMVLFALFHKTFSRSENVL